MNEHKEIAMSGSSTDKLASCGRLGSTAVAHAEVMGEVGQCHGVNACQGKGDCQATANEYEGKNACKGQG